MIQWGCSTNPQIIHRIRGITLYFAYLGVHGLRVAYHQALQESAKADRLSPSATATANAIGTSPVAAKTKVTTLHAEAIKLIK